MFTGSKSERSSNVLVNFCAKGFFVLLAMGFTGFCSYAYISWFILPYLIVGLPDMNEKPANVTQNYGYFLLLIHVFLVSMLTWSLLKTYHTNPGYVADYFKSVKVDEKIKEQN
jgi:hypothetical protein